MIEIKSETKLLWGHPLKIWDTGREIRVPQFVFPVLNHAGCLMDNKATLLPIILLIFDDYEQHALLIDKEGRNIMLVLGPDLSGPAECKCTCKTCREQHQPDDDTPLPQQGTRNRNVDPRLSDKLVRELTAKRKYR